MFSRPGVRTSAVVAAALLFALLLGSLTQPVLQNGDSAVYNDQVDARDLSGRTSHFGYIALGIVFRTVLPGLTDLVMNWMTVLLGVVGVVAVYYSARRLTHSEGAGVIAALGLLCIPAYLRGALISEVDVPLAAFVAIAYCFAIYGRFWVAGPLFGYAMLISPLAALTLPAFLLAPLVTQEGESASLRRWLRAVLVFGLSSLLVYATVVAVHWDDYLNGGRGLLRAPRSRFSVPLHARRSAEFLWDQPGPALLVLYLAGAIVAISKRVWPLVLGVLLAGVTAMVFGERAADVPVQLPTVALLSPLLGFPIALGSRYVRVGAALVSLAVVTHRGVGAYQAARGEIDVLANERAAYLEIKARSTLPPITVVAHGFNQARRLERIVYGATYTPYSMSARQFRRRCKSFARQRSKNSFWFIGRPPRSICPELLSRYRLAREVVQGRKFSVLVAR